MFWWVQAFVTSVSCRLLDTYTVVFVQPADIYLIDEPSAYLDSEQRIVASKVIKRFILHAKKTAFIVEHDFIMATYLADKVIVYEGRPSIDCTANAPQSLVSGMNKFLSVSEEWKLLNMTRYRNMGLLAQLCWSNCMGSCPIIFGSHHRLIFSSIVIFDLHYSVPPFWWQKITSWQI